MTFESLFTPSSILEASIPTSLSLTEHLTKPLFSQGWPLLLTTLADGGLAHRTIESTQGQFLKQGFSKPAPH